MRGWHLTKRGDYINGELAGRTRAGIVSLARSGLWAYVVRDLNGQEKGRGANFPTAAAAMQAAEAFTTPAEPNHALAAQVMAFLRTKTEGAS